jgi:hypothetical protein
VSAYTHPSLSDYDGHPSVSDPRCHIYDVSHREGGRSRGGFVDTLSLHYISQTSAEMGDDDDALPAGEGHTKNTVQKFSGGSVCFCSRSQRAICVHT